MKGIVNIRYRAGDMDFDAAVDYEWQLHLYQEISEEKVPVELYCFDHPEWDVKVVFINKSDISHYTVIKEWSGCHRHTVIDMDKIISETYKWIKENEEADI